MSLAVGNIISAQIKAVSRSSSLYGVVTVGDSYTQLVELSNGTTPMLKGDGHYIITTIINGFTYVLQQGSVTIDQALV